MAAPDLIGLEPLAKQLVSVRDLNEDDCERRRFSWSMSMYFVYHGFFLLFTCNYTLFR